MLGQTVFVWSKADNITIMLIVFLINLALHN